MNNSESEVKKIKTKIIPAIHNTISLRVFLKTEDGTPLADQQVLYKFLKIDGENDKIYKLKTDEEGEAILALGNITNKTIEIIYEGNQEYEECKITTLKVNPTQKEKDIKNNHPLISKRREEKKLQKEREREEAQRKKEEEEIIRIEEYEESQTKYELVGEDNIAIELKNVSLSFKIGKDKIDNLKEYVIRTINRTKEKKTLFKATDNVSFKI